MITIVRVIAATTVVITPMTPRRAADGASDARFRREKSGTCGEVAGTMFH